MYQHKGIKTQQHSKKLEKRLHSIIEYQHPLTNHLVCLPDFFDFGQRPVPYGKHLFRLSRWKGIARRFSCKIPDNEKQYGSSFVFRPEIFDIDYKEYFKSVQDVFTNKKFVVVGNPHTAIKTFTKEAGMQIIKKIDTPKTNAFNCHSETFTKCKKTQRATKDLIFLLSIGISAKVLAYDLCSLGTQAIDIGNFFKIFHWYQKGVLR
jgi:hypothetical protein